MFAPRISSKNYRVDSRIQLPPSHPRNYGPHYRSSVPVSGSVPSSVHPQNYVPFPHDSREFELTKKYKPVAVSIAPRLNPPSQSNEPPGRSEEKPNNLLYASAYISLIGNVGGICWFVLFDMIPVQSYIGIVAAFNSVVASTVIMIEELKTAKKNNNL